MTTTKMKGLEGLPRLRALRPDVAGTAVRGIEKDDVKVVGGGVAPRVEETAFTRQSDLEAYARGLSISPEVIEKWISAGLLFPDEIRMAEKIIKILREKIKVS